jgi:crotonobetainyl-CoA:carnitine CoA-transferase CaiB-like acyl-CoA transferase
MTPAEMEKKFGPRQDPNRIWGIFEVKDGWIQIAGERPKAIDLLRERLGVEEANREIVAEHIKGMTRMEAFSFLSELGMPVAPIYEAHEAMGDPHLLARGMWVEVDHPTAGRYTVPNFPVMFSETPGEVTSASPMLGQHTEEVLTTLLGYTPERVRELEKEGKIACWRGQ